MKKFIVSCFVFATFFIFIDTYAQENTLINSGPMVCYSTMQEVLIWVQTKQAARVKIKYKAENQNLEQSTNEILTNSDSAFIAKLIVTVLPSQKYIYKVLINDNEIKFDYELSFKSQTLWQHRFDPPSFTFAIGSCAYFNDSLYDRPGEPYGGAYGIYWSINAKNPDFMLWLGDNDYLREADWDSWTGIKNRFSHGRAYKELQPLLGKTHHYAIWDDHDFGSNDADRSFSQKENTLKAFKLFWGNQSYGTKENDGIFSVFSWADAEFFLLDNRYYRTPNNSKTQTKEILGEAQINWLRDKLISSEAKFKFIAMGGQFLNNVAKYENYANAIEEKAKLLKMIADENIKGVIFLSGDRHFSELSKMDREVYPLYEITCSPLNSTARGDSTEKNSFRVNGTWVCERNFATLTISGKAKNRVLLIKMFNSKGDEIWYKEISQSELGYK